MPGDAEALLLTARQLQAALTNHVLGFIPQDGAPQRHLDALVKLASR